jgi:oryzin
MYASALTTQSGSIWSLGRISHKNAGATSYIYDDTAGSASTVYVVDTGIYIELNEFGGHARWGTNFVTGSIVSHLSCFIEHRTYFS